MDTFLDVKQANEGEKSDSRICDVHELLRFFFIFLICVVENFSYQTQACIFKTSKKCNFRAQIIDEFLEFFA